VGNTVTATSAARAAVIKVLGITTTQPHRPQTVSRCRRIAPCVRSSGQFNPRRTFGPPSSSQKRTLG
jgi:hypothetical protein